MEIFGINIPIYYIIIGIIIFILLIVIIVKLVSKSNKVTGEETSILDVNEVGVNEVKDFSYGYEKEETIVMDKVIEEKKEDE